MANEIRSTAAAREYAVAHEAHYGTRDLARALALYREVFTAYPDSAEAGYSQAQIQNITKGVVPQSELVAAQADLALAHIEAKSSEPASEPAEPVPPATRGIA